MLNFSRQKKGVALLIVLGALLIVIGLAGVIMKIMLSQSRLTQHQVNRIKAFYAAQAGVNYTLEALRAGIWSAAAGSRKYACMSGCIDTGITADYTIPADSDIPYQVQVTIYPLAGETNGTTRVDVKTQYTYTP